MLGFSFSLLCRGGSDTSATTGWTDRNPWEITRGEPRLEGGTRKRRQGGRTGRNSLGRAPLGGSDTEATTMMKVNMKKIIFIILVIVSVC